MNFGTYPLSVMGIENAIRRADANVDAYTSRQSRVNDGPIAYAVVAIRAWERRYPGDPWIAKDLLALARFYERVGLPETSDDAEPTVAWVTHDYPHTAYALAAAHLIGRGEREANADPEPVTSRSAVALPPYAHPEAGH